MLKIQCEMNFQNVILSCLFLGIVPVAGLFSVYRNPAYGSHHLQKLCLYMTLIRERVISIKRYLRSQTFYTLQTPIQISRYLQLGISVSLDFPVQDKYYRIFMEQLTNLKYGLI
uniref:Uncharacterized protein n=1 Tax=Cacopsylla melanoneura TaxID=428564 RepID=A0A8D9BVQ4_9HEMI